MPTTGKKDSSGGGGVAAASSAASARLEAAELAAECQAADLHAVKRRLFQLEQQIGSVEKTAEYTESRLSRLQLILILTVALTIGGYCVFRVYGLTGLLIGAVTCGCVGAMMHFDEGSGRK